MTSQLLFHRPELAKHYSRLVLSVSIGSASLSGVFFAAPRRTGKSTFVREDLRPELEKNGALVVYADLWSNPTTDPGDVIVGAIRSKLSGDQNVLLRLAKKGGIDKVKMGNLSFDLDRIGLGKAVSLTDALVALSDESKKMIVLIIDEAQHAITTDAGNSALFALKAARDELNSSSHHGLRVICTGSNQDKLAMLRNSKDQAFFGAPMVKFPTLGKDYIEWFCSNAGLPFPLDPEEVWQLFGEAGYRPELLGSAADKFRFDFEADATNGPERFATEVRQLAADLNKTLRSVIHGLTPIQSAVLRVMATAGDNYAPFEASTMAKYKNAQELAGVPAEDVKVDVAGAQQALIALQEKKLVWRAARGVYAVEEKAIIELLRADGLLAGLE